MRRITVCVLAFTALLLTAVPAAAQTPTLDQAGAALRREPVYADSAAERPLDRGAADRVRQRIRSRGIPVFIAVLPSAAVNEAGGDPSRLPSEVQRRVGLAGTYGVVAGSSFRAGSTNLPAGRAGAAATAAFQAHAAEGVEAVLLDFVDRVAAAGQSSPDTRSGPFDGGGGGGEERSSKGPNLLPILLLLAVGIGGIVLWQRSKRRREEARDEEDLSHDRSLLEAELAVLAEDVMNLEPRISLHPEARADYEAGVSRFRVARAALDAADEPIDLVRVRRVLDEGSYAMTRARAIVEGREPPPPPPELTRRGRHDEPALDTDERGRPRYADYDAPFYGGGWFGGGGGLLTGLFLGQMLGGWGGRDVYIDNSGGGGDGGDGGGWGGGDFGGGDFGGGDFGGGDIGGGDW